MSYMSKDKIETTVALVDRMMVDPDIELEYCIIESLEDDTVEDSYTLVSYSEDTYITRKLPLNDHYSDQTPEEIANYLTFSVEQFKEEVDSLKYGM